MKWARVENNTVIETIDFNPIGCFTEEIVRQFVETSESVEQGYVRQDGTDELIKPEPIPPTEEEIKAEQRKDIQQQLDELDKKSIRDAEDLCDLLIKRGLIVAADVPFMKQRKDQKVTLREALKNIT